MDQNQKRYAMQRIEQSMNSKVDAAKDKHSKKTKGVSDTDKVQAVRNGNVSLKYPSSRITLKTTVADAFDFSDLEPRDVLDVAAFKKEERAIRSAASKVKDEIMLGDGKKAIALIRKFCGEL